MTEREQKLAIPEISYFLNGGKGTLLVPTSRDLGRHGVILHPAFRTRAGSLRPEWQEEIAHFYRIRKRAYVKYFPKMGILAFPMRGYGRTIEPEQAVVDLSIKELLEIPEGEIEKPLIVLRELHEYFPEEFRKEWIEKKKAPRKRREKILEGLVPYVPTGAGD